MAEGPRLTTPRLMALPLTLWNAGFVADELAEQLGHSGALQAPDGDPAAPLRRDLRRRASSGYDVLTWVIRSRDGEALGLMSVDTEHRRAVVTVSIGQTHRRRGYATEALRAVSGWIESGRSAVVEARVRRGDLAAERLVVSTSFMPTEILLEKQWRIWLRPPSP